MDLSPALVSQISLLSRSAGARRVVLFGSRARGDNRPRSDVDLAVYGLPSGSVGAFRLALEDLPTLLNIDFVPVDPDTSPALLAEIQRDGVTLYESPHETD